MGKEGQVTCPSQEDPDCPYLSPMASAGQGGEAKKSL